MNPVLRVIYRIGSGLLVSVATAGVHPVPAINTGLTHALASAQPGDTLLLAEGRHVASNLILPDGLTVIGQGTGAHFEGRGGQPFFIIDNATNGVLLQNLVLHGARCRENGGAIRAYRSRLALKSVTIAECRSTRAGGALYAQDSHVELRDCRFLDNRADDGGAIALPARDTNAVMGRLLVDNSLFAGNRARTGGALSSAVPATVTHGTFAGNVVEGTDAAGSAIRAGSSLELLMCNLVDNRDGQPGAGPVALSKDNTLLVSYTNIHGNSGGDGSGDPVESRTGNGNLSVDPGFVDAGHGDYRLRWDSPLMDRGPGNLEFDLTLPDIGWKPTVPTHRISGNVSTDLSAHNYEITDDCTIMGSIPAGATLRVGSARSLVIQVAGSGDRYIIGDAEGPRTAIVGRPGENARSASSIGFVPGTESSRVLQLEGMMFNYPAIPGPGNGELGFSSPMASEPLPVVLDGDLLQFRHYSNVTQGSSVHDACLSFRNCTGSISNLDIGIEGGMDPTRLQAYMSSLGIEGCSFQPSATPQMRRDTPLRIHGTLNAETPILKHNAFRGSMTQFAPMADFTNTVQRLEHNQFIEMHTTALIQSHSTIHMDQDARNHILAGANWNGDAPLWTMEGGDLNLHCGYNSFVYSGASEFRPIIAYTKSPGDSIPPRDWRWNYWGVDCSSAITEADLKNLNLVPGWAAIEDSHNRCVPMDTMDNPACDNPGMKAGQLLIDGIISERAGNLEKARGNYFYLLALYPDSKEATEGTLLLKALGQHYEYGLEHSSDIHGDLLAVADSAEAVNQHGLAVLQASSAWCVEALYGDRPAAVSALTAAYAAEADTNCRETIALALAEIATYPAQGGQSPSGPKVRYAQALVLQQAVQALLDFQRGTTRVAEFEGKTQVRKMLLVK